MLSRTAWQPWFAWHPVTVTRELAPDVRNSHDEEEIREFVWLQTVDRRRVDGRWEYRGTILTWDEYEGRQW